MFASFLEKRLIQDPGWNLWGNGGDAPGGGNTAAGMTVTELNALKLLVVYGSISFISDLIGQLPIDQFRKVGKTKSEVLPKAAWLEQPNPELDGQDFITQFIASLLTAGNSYTIVLRSSLGQVGELWPQHPDDVYPHRDRPGAPLEWYLRGQLYRGEIKHVKGFSLPGSVLGCNPITYAREAIGSGLAAQEYGARFFSNGALPAVVIEAPGGPETVNAEKIRGGVDKFHRGASKAHGTLVLTGGMTAKALTISQADAQFLEGRNFTATEIATQLYRIPSDLQGAAIPGSSLTYQNIEQRWTELVRRCFSTWITKYERAMTSLLPRPQFVKLNSDAYMRADLKTQYESFAIGLEHEFLAKNEVRDLIDMPPLPGGDLPTPPAPAPTGATA